LTDAQLSKSKKSENRRETTAQAVYDLILERGFSGVTLRELAARTGVTTGAIVHYIRTKDALLVEAENYVRTLLHERAAEADALNGMAAFKHMLYWFLPADDMKTGYWSITFSLWERARENPSLQTILQEAYAELQDYLIHFLRKIQTENEAPPGLDLVLIAQTAIGLVEGLSIRHFIADRDYPGPSAQEIVGSWIETWA
jgi:AcrR family transcriptional regulator